MKLNCTLVKNTFGNEKHLWIGRNGRNDSIPNHQMLQTCGQFRIFQNKNLHMQHLRPYAKRNELYKQNNHTKKKNTLPIAKISGTELVATCRIFFLQ